MGPDTFVRMHPNVPPTQMYPAPLGNSIWRVNYAFPATLRGMDHLSASPHLFVARDEELARMLGFIDQAMGGKGSVCFVTGEPGAGKSTLLEEFSRRALHKYPELFFAAGDCNPQTGIVDPFLPFREIMSGLTGAEDSSNDASVQTSGRSKNFFRAAARMLAEHGPDLNERMVMPFSP